MTASETVAVATRSRTCPSTPAPAPAQSRRVTLVSSCSQQLLGCCQMSVRQLVGWHATRHTRATHLKNKAKRPSQARQWWGVGAVQGCRQHDQVVPCNFRAPAWLLARLACTWAHTFDDPHIFSNVLIRGSSQRGTRRRRLDRPVAAISQTINMVSWAVAVLPVSPVRNRTQQCRWFHLRFAGPGILLLVV
jgi:hypothetical protein